MRKTIGGGNHDFSTAQESLGPAQVQRIVLLGLGVDVARSRGLTRFHAAAVPDPAKAEGSRAKEGISAWELPRSLCASARYNGAARR
jgi:hypothetical protein